MHTRRLAVYVPNPDADARTSLSVRNIDQGSGIVGEPVPMSVDRVVVYFEGNRYGAQNIVTFADRCRHAAGRLTERYPTVAHAAVPREAVTQVAWYYPKHGRVEPLDGRSLYLLSRWLEMPIDGPRPEDQLEREVKLAREFQETRR